jgi:hypothetical protein
MHGMVSAGILIAMFAVVAVAGLYVAVRVYLAGGPRKAAAGPGPGAEAAGLHDRAGEAHGRAAGLVTEREGS